MSKMASHTLTCPKCRNSQEVMIWDSLKVDHDSNLKEKLFGGEINIFKCASCEYESFVNKPLLYHDLMRKYCIQYYPPELIEEESFYTNFTVAGKVNIPGIPDGNYLKEPHIVFNINEMIIYIAFRDKLFKIHHKQ